MIAAAAAYICALVACSSVSATRLRTIASPFVTVRKCPFCGAPRHCTNAVTEVSPAKTGSASARISFTILVASRSNAAPLL
jgi:hypothetical protein